MAHENGLCSGLELLHSKPLNNITNTLAFTLVLLMYKCHSHHMPSALICTACTSNILYSSSHIYSLFLCLIGPSHSFLSVLSSFTVLLIDDWSTAANTHVVGILPMLTTQFISLVITTPETETVNFTVSSLNQTIANGSVTAGTPTTISDSTLLS